MRVRNWAWGIVLLLVASAATFWRPVASAQVNTNEGGGQEYVDQLYGRRTVRDSRIGAIEDDLSRLEQRTAGDIQQQIRLIRLFEAHSRKLAELESRIQVLESLQRLNAPAPQKPTGLSRTGGR